MRYEVIIAENSGFCFGVRNAINKSEELKKDIKEDVATLGPLIHNPQEVGRLESKGIIPKDDISQINEKNVIIRTHGVSPYVVKDLENKKCTVHDFTCPFVKKLQEYARDYTAQGFQVYILGDANHPEVIGVIGWTDGKAIPVQSLEEAKKLEISNGKICLISQTTEKEKKFSEVADYLLSINPETVIVDTICQATQSRQQSAYELAKKVDLMLIIGGLNSSNTNKLAQITKSVNQKTHHIEKASDLIDEWFEGVKKVGISAGASTPKWIIEEVIKGMEGIKESMEMAELVENERTFKRGDVLQGVVVQVEKERAYVDIGAKTEGILESDEISLRKVEDVTAVLKVGDEITVRIIDIESEVMKLSQKRLDNQKAIDRLIEAKENNEIIEAEIYEAVKGGILADVGVRGFVPASLIDVGYVDDLKQFVGQKLQLMVEEINLEDRKYILSRKAIQQAKIDELWGTLNEGETKVGAVKRLVDFGAFIDLGGIEGLLHISEMGWGKVEKPSDVLEVGQEVEVYLLKVNKEEGKIALSLKKLTPSPWEVVNDKYQAGDVVKGKVVRFAGFGAFVEVEPGLDGLVHISQIDWTRVEKVEDVLTIGQEVETKILDIDAKNKKLSLSIKETKERPVKKEVPKKKEEKPAVKEEKKAAPAKPTAEKPAPAKKKAPAKPAAPVVEEAEDQEPSGVNIGELFGDKLKGFM